MARLTLKSLSKKIEVSERRRRSLLVREEKRRDKRAAAIEKKKAKAAANKIDGITPRDVEKISRAIRQIWSWSNPRKLCVKRATRDDGFPVCELCKCITPKVYADHITPVGNMLGAADVGYIERMFAPSKFLQALCKKCHDKKTRQENKARRIEAEIAKGFL